MTNPAALTYIALLHFPVYDRKGNEICTAITNLDIHDLARSAKTYGLAGYHLVTPLERQRELASRIIACWEGETTTRAEALRLVRIMAGLEESIAQITCESGRKPICVATSAREIAGRETRTCEVISREIRAEPSQPWLLVLGTGWGLSRTVLESCDSLLAPVRGPGTYNHLPVRAAAAILLDRLFGR